MNTKDHDLVILIDGRAGGQLPHPLPEDSPWRARFKPLEPLSAYATTFRYSLSPKPKAEELRLILATLTEAPSHRNGRAALRGNTVTRPEPF